MSEGPAQATGHEQIDDLRPPGGDAGEAVDTRGVDAADPAAPDSDGGGDQGPAQATDHQD